jgi:predicted MFS family arabinose efflux permease
MNREASLTTARTNRLAQIVLVSAAVAFYWSSLYLYVPTLGIYAESLIHDLGQVGVVLSMYGLWQAIVRLPLGIAADWLGQRKPFILLGFALAALGAWMMMTGESYAALAAGRAVTGLSAAAWVPLAVLFSSLFPPKEAVRATALLSLINSLSRVISTGVTGTLNGLGGYGLAFSLAIAAAALAVIAILPAHEPKRAPAAPSLGGIAALITRRDVLLPALLSAVGQYVVWATTFGFLPTLAKDLGASDNINSLLVSLSLFLGMAGNLLTTVIVRRIGEMRLLYASYLLLVLGVLTAALAPNLGVILLAQAILGFGGGISYPLCMGMSIRHVDEAQRATAMGLHQAVYAIGMFAGPALSGALARGMGIQPMFAVTAAGTLALSLVLAQYLREDRAAAR